MKTYCVKCRKDTKDVDPKMIRTKNNRLVVQSKFLFVELKNEYLLKNKKQKFY